MFFSVKRAMIIGNKVYYPCICYEISSALEKTVIFLKNKGKAEIYPIKVHFQNGKVIENLSKILGSNKISTVVDDSNKISTVVDGTVTKRKTNRDSKPKNSGFKDTPVTEELGQKLRDLPEVEAEVEAEIEAEVETEVEDNDF